MKLVNYHTHTTFCDGADTPEDIVLTAIEKGFDLIGFSEHGYIHFDKECSMTKAGTAEYIKTVSELKEKYRDKIKILCGIEQDYYNDPLEDKFDYVIGSVHYVKVKDEYLVIDGSANVLEDGINRLFAGDAMALCEAYYKNVADVVKKTDCDIIGHFDLVTKFNEKRHLINEDDPRYIKAAFDALDALIPEDRLFEINTGAISRGHRTTPYPSRRILTEIGRRGGRVILSSDSHRKETIDCAFSEALALAAECGIKNVETDIFQN